MASTLFLFEHPVFVVTGPQTAERVKVDPARGTLTIGDRTFGKNYDAAVLEGVFKMLGAHYGGVSAQLAASALVEMGVKIPELPAPADEPF